jgi:hypothetical protein
MGKKLSNNNLYLLANQSHFTGDVQLMIVGLDFDL